MVKRMRLVDADELMGHVYRDKLDSREQIAEMIQNAPTQETQQDYKLLCEELKGHIDHLRMQRDIMKGEIKALAFAVRCNGISGNEVRYEID